MIDALTALRGTPRSADDAGDPATKADRRSRDARPRTNASRILSWRWPRLYEFFFRIAPTSQQIRSKEVAAVLQQVDSVRRPEQSVVEVGCGPGTYTGHLASRFAHVTALDAADGMVRFMTRRMSREGHANVEGVRGTIPEDLVAATGAAGIVAAGVLDYADDLTGWLTALRRCLEPGGWIVFTVPMARTAPRAAGAVEGVLAGYVFPRTDAAVREAVADAGLRLRCVDVVEHRGTAYTLVGSAISSRAGA